MNDPIVLHLPESMYESVHRAADESHRSVEEMLLNRIKIMYEEPSALLEGDTLDKFSDEDLWTVVYQKLEWKQQAQARELISKGKSESLSAMEQQELERLLAVLNKYMLLRSKAAAILHRRGYDTGSLLNE
jgi:hypothetical protein